MNRGGGLLSYYKNIFVVRARGCRGYQMMPWPIMALATFMNPAMFAPFM